MVVVSICGSAGRNNNHLKITPLLFEKLYNLFLFIINKIEINKGEKINLLSGGAAFIDHIAVKLFLNFPDRFNLHLALPCNFHKNEFEYYSSTGKTANYYHKLFSEQMSSQQKVNSLREISEAVEKGAAFSIHKGFKARNSLIANCDYLLAAGFSSCPTGGTKDTYDKCVKAKKIYFNIETDLIPSSL